MRTPRGLEPHHRREPPTSLNTSLAVITSEVPTFLEDAALRSIRAALGTGVPLGLAAARAADVVADLREKAFPIETNAGTVFSVRYGRARKRFVPLLFAEYANGEHAVEVTLFRAAGGAATIERQGWFPLRLTPRRTLAEAAVEVGRWIAAAVSERGPDIPAPAAQPDAAVTPFTAKTAVFAFGTIAGMALRRVARRVRRRRHGWNIGVIDAPIETLLLETPAVRWLALAGNEDTLADPFALPSSPDIIVCERINGRHGVGEIVSVDLRSGSIAEVLCTPEHLSFPFVFEHAGALYALPESHMTGRITLYRVQPDPLRFVDPITLVDIDGCDPTIVRWADRWWLFCTRASRLPDTNLFVYFADTLTGPWMPHARNPVKTDIRGARPAGTPFVYNGTLYRPAQDCSTSYGAAVVLQRVDALTPDAFAERPVRRLEPDRAGPFPDGLHTVSAAGTRCFIDGRRDVAG